MNLNKWPISLWSESTSNSNGGMANLGEESSTSSWDSAERQPVHRQLQSGGPRVETSAAPPGTAGKLEGSNRGLKEKSSAKRDDCWDNRARNQSKVQGLNDNCQELSKKDQGLSDLASTRRISRSVQSATHGQGRNNVNDGNRSDVSGGLLNSSSNEERYDNVSPGSNGARARNVKNATSNKDLDLVDSWEFVDKNSVADVSSDVGRSFDTPLYNTSAQGSSDDFGIGKIMGGGPRCGTARRETKGFGTPEGGNKCSIENYRSGEACDGGSNNSYSRKNTSNEKKMIAGCGMSRGKSDAESGRTRNKKHVDCESSEGSANSVCSESSDSSCESDSGKRINHSGGSSDEGKSCDRLKNSFGRNFADEEKPKGINGEDRGSKTIGHGYQTYGASKYRQNPNSRDVLEGVHSKKSLSRDGGAIPKYNHSLSDRKSNSARDEVEIPKEITRLPIAEIEYKWQFQNEHGSWITYGQSNSEGAYPTSSQVTSDDIDNYYLTDPEKIPLLITTAYNSYVLNFQTMTQINERTKVQRTIRRVPKHEAADTLPPTQHGIPLSAFASGNRIAENDLNTAGGSVDRQYYHGNGIPTRKTRPVSHEWQFENEFGYWITFGQPSSAFELESFSNSSTDAIEEFFSTQPDKLMTIQTNHNDYTLNFRTMTQMNKNTQVHRRIRRVPKSKSVIGYFLTKGYRKIIELFWTESSTGNSNNGDMQFVGMHQNAITNSNPMTVSSSNTVENFTNCNTNVDAYLGNMSLTQNPRSTGTVDRVRRSAAYGEQLDLANWAGNTECSQSRFALSSFNDSSAAGSSHLNRAIHDSQRPLGTEAASIGYENLIGGAHASGSHYTSNPGHANPNFSQTGNNLVNFSSTGAPHDVAGVRYVWQFQDELGAWITYGQPNSLGNIICATSATSDDIERHYSIHQTRKPMIIQSSHNMYVLDFQTMIQTNESTLVQRPFRRVLIHLSLEQ